MASKTPPSDALAAWLAGQRWFAAKTRRIVEAAVDDLVPLGEARIAIVTARLDDGSTDRYVIPLGGGDGVARGGEVVAAATGSGDAVADATDTQEFPRALLALIGRAGRVAGERGEVVGRSTSAFPAELPDPLVVRKLGGEQSNTSVTLGGRLILKLYRRLREGINPDQELTRFLTEETPFRHTPRLAGWAEYRAGESCATLAVVQELVTGARDGWEWMLEELAALYRRARESGRDPDAAAVAGLAGPTLPALRRLGELTAELHLAFASAGPDPALAPEPISAADLDRWVRDVTVQLEAAWMAGGAAAPVDRLDLARGLQGLLGRQQTRHHGDYHLGQTLHRERERDFVIIDFEGEPARPLAERRRKHTPLRDVAGMLRSIAYAAVSGMPAGLDRWAELWERQAVREFLTGYRTTAGPAPFLPDGEEAFLAAVAVFEVEKAAYEIVYEANNRPAWIGIPVRGLTQAAARTLGAGHGGPLPPPAA
jgi:predicted trehalose synthase